MILAAEFERCADRYGGGTAVSGPDSCLGYDALHRAGLRAAEWFGGVRAADERPRIGLAARNSTAWVTAYLGILHAGAVPFLIDASASDGELERISEDCSLDLLLHDRDAAGEAVPVLPGLTAVQRYTAGRRHPLHPDTEVCRFTSGTTGKPNCLEFSGQAVRAAAANWAAGTGMTADDRVLCCAGLSNGLAFNTSLLAAFLVGAQLHLAHGLPTSGRIRRLVAGSRATRLVAFPALYDSFVRTGGGRADFASVRVAISSGAPLRPETKERFTALTGVPMGNYYGVAEAGPLTYSTSTAAESLGRPLPGVDIQTRGPDPQDGAVHVRSASMATRYLNAPGLLESRIDDAGRYATGDRGRLEDGELVLTGRSHRMINVGGRKVDPVEVGEAVGAVPGVEQAVVLEAPDQHGEPAVAAVLVLRAGSDPGEVRLRLRGSLADSLAAHKIPTLIRVVDALPTTVIGKPVLHELRSLFDTGTR
ncbi:class I adenylate-forming enzyme family protein [Streptomyces indicus]|uniref:Acyl-CoA synthetase (AMP-forming)/AMP-acid ligase II n=1 Tax=Streptomyces indicus TaxID=417292 RepID=A0A1G9ALI4_9ACTN|nr:class I adenylate-forming enzyme family protein [Streptomyces indicus]SDK28103.1 Acyl-CoA synthetase (AMP-forming)/AMP-acid ligase II [Streptomyces indicus]